MKWYHSSLQNCFSRFDSWQACRQVGLQPRRCGATLGKPADEKEQQYSCLQTGLQPRRCGATPGKPAMLIIGITGTNGAGKGTVVEYLVEKEGFVHFSARAYITEILKKKGMVPDRENLISMGDELRRKYGPSALAILLFEEAVKTNKNCIIESIRTVGEIEELKKKGEFYLLAVDADPEIRYERIVKRGSDTDKMSYEKFREMEKLETENEDPNKMNIFACMKRADYVLKNNGTKEELFEQVKEVLKSILA